jgi:hypothetical protein
MKYMKRVKYIMIGIWIGILMCGISAMPSRIEAQQEGFLGTSDVAPPSSDDMLPPGAVLRGTSVQHTIQSKQENLHLLASFYYGNPREWRKIYEDNRDVIKNPNRLPVGEVIQIHVGDNWQPKVAYEKWFALAVRNGEWQPGVPWQRANAVPVPSSPPPDMTPSVPASTEPESQQPPAPTSQEQPHATVPTEAPPSEHPAEQPGAPKESMEPESTPLPENGDATAPEQTPAEEETPAEPAF